MRIAYIGNFTRPWCTEVHVTAALQELGHSVARLQENRTNLGQQTKVLLAGAARPGRQATPTPELFIWTRTWGVERRAANSMMEQCRAAGVPVVSFHLDRYLGIEREAMVDSEPFFRTDILFTPDTGDWAAHGVNDYWMPPGVDRAEANAVYQPNPKRWPWKVVMVGSFPYPHPDWHPVRAAVVKHLRDRYGPDFAMLPADIGGRPIRNADLGELYATVPVVVGDSCWAGMADDPGGYWSDRVTETLGRGGYLIHPYSDKLAQSYPDLALYPLGSMATLDGLIDERLTPSNDIIKASLERARVGNRELVLKRDTYLARMAELVAVATGRRPLQHERIVPPTPVLTSAAEDARAAPAPPPRALRTVPRVPESPEPADEPQTATKVVTGAYRPKRLRYAFAVAEGVTDAYAVKEVWDDDQYRMAELDLSGCQVIDVGANLGAFSILAAMLGAKTVHAYEPHPETYQCLEANVAGSRVASRIVTHQAAVGGWVRTDELVGAGGGAHLSPSGIGDVEVAVWDIDSVIGAAAPYGEVVLKLDCEGGEYEIIDAITDWPPIRVLVMEWHGPGMPHLGHIDEARWGPMVQRLAEHGITQIDGHPRTGGLIWCRRYKY